MSNLFIIFNVVLISLAVLVILEHEKQRIEMRNKERKIKRMEIAIDKIYEIRIKKLTGNGEVKK